MILKNDRRDKVSKQISVGNYCVNYEEDFELIFVYPPDYGLQSGLTKQDLLSMLKLFEERGE